MFDRETREAAERAQRYFEQGIQAALPELRRALGFRPFDYELATTKKSLLLQVRDGFRKAARNFV